MPYANFPNVALSEGKLRKSKIQSISSVSLGTSIAPQTEVDIPARGDLIALEIQVNSISATGTLVGPDQLDKIIDQVAVRDRGGRLIWSKIRGVDLEMLDRYYNIGRSRTVPTISNSAQSHSFLIPMNIELADQTARVQVQLSALASIGTSGQTAATVSYEIVAWYTDISNLQFTQRFRRISQTISAGEARFGPNLPKGVTIQDLLFKVGTESNLTSVNFSADGKLELDDLTVKDMTVIDDTRMVSGHVSGEFSLYNAPFISTTETILDVTGAGADTIEWFIVTLESSNNN